LIRRLFFSWYFAFSYNLFLKIFFKVGFVTIPAWTTQSGTANFADKNNIILLINLTSEERIFHLKSFEMKT